jgi:dUTP pyrophosphatase
MRIRVDGELPVKSSLGAAAFDLRSSEGITIAPLKRAVIKCGIKIEIPEGMVGLICPRSGMALKYGVTVLNAPGVIDPDYRGEIGVILINLGDSDFQISIGDRIAQIMFVPTAYVSLIKAGSLSVSERMEGGFGSTGK